MPPLPTDPVSISLLMAVWAAISKVPEGIPTELAGAWLGETIKDRMDGLRKKLAATGQPGANHDLRRALTDSFWLSLLYVAARHGERVNQPVPWTARLNAHLAIERTWRAIREQLPGGQPAPGFTNEAISETVKVLYPKLMAKLEDSLDAGPPQGIDEAYASVEALLVRVPANTQPLAFMQTLTDEAVRHFNALAGETGVPAVMADELERDFPELFRGAFAEAIKTETEVRAILDATLLSEVKTDTTEILRLLRERLPAASPPTPCATPDEYIKDLRKITGYIELVGLQDPVPIDKLWVAARTRVASREAALVGAEATEELSAALNREKVLVIEGVAGSGKSTFLKRIAYALCREDRGSNETLKLNFAGHPLWLQITVLEAYLRPLHPHGLPVDSDLRWIARSLAEQSAKRAWGLNEAWFTQQLADPSAILLLDGLDEASAPWRPVLAKLILAARDKLACRIAVTMRPEAEYKAPLLADIKDRCSIEELGPREIAEFVHLWTEHVLTNDRTDARADAAKLLANLQSNPAVGRLARNPLMLGVLAALTRKGVPLPEERAELYGKIVDWLALARYESGEADKLLGYLSILSLRMIQRGENKYQIGYADAANLIAEEFPVAPPLQKSAVAEQYLRDAQLRCGLIKERGGDVVFFHREFQEYLAANYLAHEPDEDCLRIAVELLEKQQSPETLRLLAGCFQCSRSFKRLTKLFEHLIASAPEGLERRAYTAGVIGGLRADLIPEKYQMAEALQKPYDSLVKSVLAIFDLEESKKISIPIRRDAAEALAQGGDPRLRLPRKHSDYWVRVEGGRLGERDIPTFLMGQYPVTVYEYGVYLESNTGLPEPRGWEEQKQHQSRPVVRVSWSEAKAYCEWAGGRLPTEWEWEFAASMHGAEPGAKPRLFPWGNKDATPAHANYDQTRMASPTPVGLFPEGATPGRKIFDLAGNVWEWTLSDYEPGRDWKVLRGGAYFVDAAGLRAAYRGDIPPGVRGDDIGFRCVREVSP